MRACACVRGGASEGVRSYYTANSSLLTSRNKIQLAQREDIQVLILLNTIVWLITVRDYVCYNVFESDKGEQSVVVRNRTTRNDRHYIHIRNYSRSNLYSRITSICEQVDGSHGASSSVCHCFHSFLLSLAVGLLTFITRLLLLLNLLFFCF